MQNVLQVVTVLFAHTMVVTAVTALVYLILTVIVALVATFSHGERSDNAYRVLKVLLKRRNDMTPSADTISTKGSS